MVDRWLDPLQAITANDYQTSQHTPSTGEMKTIGWWETVGGGIRPSGPNISQAFLFVVTGPQRNPLLFY